jgi:NodT family efflux transporter outer membrane factor (OMF) lipoprotein
MQYDSPVFASRVFVYLSLVPLILGAAGCIKVGPDYLPPEPPVPDAWHTAAVAGLAEGEAGVQIWWTVLGDSILNDLVARAQEANLDLRSALHRVEEARALRGIATGERVPSVEASGSYDRLQASENGLPGGDGSSTDLWNIGVGAAWEIDVFGRVRRGVESATAGFEASVEDYRDVLVSVLAEVASSYVDVRSLQARIDFARSNVENQDQTLRLTRDRFAAGLVSALDVAQAESILAETRSRIPLLESELEFAFNRLAVLLGEPPGTLQAELGSDGNIPLPPASVAVGLPADLLRQRPDIRSAERVLASQTALIGVATADLYPSFGLAGTLGLEAVDFSDLGESSSLGWSAGGFFRWDIFAGGRIRSRIRVEEARTAQALAAYERTVLLALEEVEDFLVAYQNEQQRRDRLAESVAATERALDLVLTQYRAGLTNFQNVLDTQRSLFDRQDLLAASEGLVVGNLIGLYRALGGGWDPDTPDPVLALAPPAEEKGTGGN